MEEYEQIGRPMHSEQLVRSRFNESLNNGQFDDCYDTSRTVMKRRLIQRI